MAGRKKGNGDLATGYITRYDEKVADRRRANRLFDLWLGEVNSMDDKAGRRKRLLIESGRRLKTARDYGRRAWKQVHTLSSGVWTFLLLSVLLVLLYALFTQLPPLPVGKGGPNGEAVVAYSDFTNMVTQGKIDEVAIRGNEISAHLKEPLKLQDASSPDETSPSTMPRYAFSTNPAQPQRNVATEVFTRMPPSGDDQLQPLLNRHQVSVRVYPANQGAGWFSSLWHFIPVMLALAGIWFFLAMRNNGKSMRSIDERISEIGKSRVRRFQREKEGGGTAARKGNEKLTEGVESGVGAKAKSIQVVEHTGVTFADVAGIDEVRHEVEEIVQFLRHPEAYKRLGARIPRGALLVGPPGTGKTLLAKAVAGEAGVPFFSMSASEFVEMYVGVGASRVRDLFNQARRSAPCIIFIDELDAVGRKRSMRITNNDERDQTLNQLLVELDGFDGRESVIVLAATNRVDILDKALLRPGRFDRHITVAAPTRSGREAILRVHTRKTPLHDNVDLDKLARLTVGMTGADLANLVNEAALIAARRDLDCLDEQCFAEALARVQLGALRPLLLDEKERKIIAVHESGHALVAHYLPEADPVNCVTILPRGQSLGVTQFVPDDDRYNYSRQMLMARIAVGLGGRVAEELTFGSEQVTTGAENDFQVVTDLARRMVTRWGMSRELGPVFAEQQAEEAYAMAFKRFEPESRTLALDQQGRPVLNGGLPRAYQSAEPTPAPVSGVALKSAIDAEVLRILDDGRALARTILSEHAAQLEKLSDALLEHEMLSREQFLTLLQD
uniref:ATP-dependent zinc metalloprotease FtsH n=1 Tax=Thermosporothrix sp. COM3 TaxID=2490863 RepID=A0A455SQ59_9CHLR|nr:ATP-dependent zinc metalloprotease FtsH [Thermosporothrix sp. COM3]